MDRESVSKNIASMNKTPKIMCLQLPSPPYLNVGRDWAGGYGIASKSTRPDYGRDPTGNSPPYISLVHSLAIIHSLGYAVSFVDAQVEQLNLKQTIERVKQINPDIIIGTINVASLQGDLKLIKKIKNNSTFIAIGTICKTIFKKILDSGNVDIVIIDDVEVILEKIINTVIQKKNLQDIPGIAYQTKGELIKTEASPGLDSLDKIPMTPFHLMKMKLYWSSLFGKKESFATILTSKGCPFPCSYYCPYPFGFGKKVIYKNPVRVVDEIETLYKEYNITNILFRDQVFTINKKHVIAISNEIQKRNLPIQWICETRFDCLNETLMQTMKDSGCVEIRTGLESGDPELFARIAKPGVDISYLQEVCKTGKKLGIKIHTHLIVGFIEESWKTVKNTVRTLKKMNIKSIQVSILTPYPGTKLYDDAVKNNLLLTHDLSLFTGIEPVMNTSFMKAEELVKARDYIYNKISAPPLYLRIINKIKRILSD